MIEGILPECYFTNNLRGLSVDMAVFRDLLKLRIPKLSKHLDDLQRDASDGNSGKKNTKMCISDQMKLKHSDPFSINPPHLNNFLNSQNTWTTCNGMQAMEIQVTRTHRWAFQIIWN